MHAIVIAGSNIDPEIHIISGLARITRHKPISAISTAYRSPALCRPEQPDYVNVAFAVEVADGVPLEELRSFLRDIESAEGRVRTDDKYASRTLDLDVVEYGDVFVDEDAFERDFVALPVAELGVSARRPTVLMNRNGKNAVVRDPELTKKIMMEIDL